MESLVAQAFNDLFAVAFNRGASSEPAVHHALTWLAATRLLLSDDAHGPRQVTYLGVESTWASFANQGLPLDGINRLAGGDPSEAAMLRAFCINAVAPLAHHATNARWDVLPLIAESAFSAGMGPWGSEVRPSVAELMLDMLGDVGNDRLWIPFDPSGTLTLRALRRGWAVNPTQLLGGGLTLLPLLLAIEFGKVVDPGQFRDDPRYVHVLAVPPFGARLGAAQTRSWPSPSEMGEPSMRSEIWASHIIRSAATGRVVSLIPPSILFSRGQDLRLRETLLQQEPLLVALDSVVALPHGAISATSMASAIVVLDVAAKGQSVHMVDLGLSRRSGPSIDTVIEQYRGAVLQRAAVDSVAKSVPREEIERDEELSFVPARYLIEPLQLGSNTVSLDELCEDLIRPPAPTRDENGRDLLEVGIPELGNWRAIAERPTKTVRVRTRAKESPLLRQGDLVISIKGTIGKVGIVGDIDGDAVVSQSCLGLRLAEQNGAPKISPQYLMMFIRSELGQAQLQALRIGAGVPHISPTTLLSSFRVPVLSLSEQAVVVARYSRLCELEAKIAELNAEMAEEAGAPWSY